MEIAGVYYNPALIAVVGAIRAPGGGDSRMITLLLSGVEKPQYLRFASEADARATRQQLVQAIEAR